MCLYALVAHELGHNEKQFLVSVGMFCKKWDYFLKTEVGHNKRAILGYT